MKDRLNASLLATLMASLLAPAASWALENGHELELAAKTVYWNDKSVANQASATAVSYQQAAQGLQLNYKSPYFSDWIGFDASLYGVVKLTDSGTPTTSLLEVMNSGKLADNYLALARAVVKMKFTDVGQIDLGRQLANNLLLKSSTTRAVAGTASSSCAIISRWTMDASSTMSTSTSSGLAASWRKCRVPCCVPSWQRPRPMPAP